MLRLPFFVVFGAILTLLQGPMAVPRFEPMQADLLSAGNTLVNAAADYDRDGDIDLFVGFAGTPTRLYANAGGALADVASDVGLALPRATRAAAWGDVDADGDPDLLIGFAPGEGSVLRLFMNERIQNRISFRDVTDGSGLSLAGGAVRQLSWIDLDADGDLDLFVAFRDRANALWRNDRGRFTDIAPARGLADPRRSVGAVWFDYDGDADLDLYVGNMDGDANGLFRNDRGQFTDVAEAAGLAWGGRAPRDAANGTVRPCAADVNNDGLLDLFTANYGPNGLFLNRGGGRFEDVSKAWGIAIDGRYDACAFSDLDHDGRLDLYVNGTFTGNVQYPDYLFRNTGERFADVTPENLRALNADHGALWADIDGDGDEDLALTGARPDGMHFVLRNLLDPPASPRSLHIAVANNVNRRVLAGAELRIYAAGTRTVLATRLVDSGSGYNAQNDMPVHIGLARTARVDVEARWPAAGRMQTTWRRNVDPTQRVNQRFTMRMRASGR